MSFTYDLASADSTIRAISRMRLELGDTTEDAGVKPDNSNLSDEELTIWLDAADGSALTAVGAAASALARMWTAVADITVGPRTEKLSQVAAGWAKRAAGDGDGAGVGGGNGGFSIGINRRDGYSSSRSEYTP